MDSKTHLILAARLLELCNSDRGAAIYSIIPTIYRGKEYHNQICSHTLNNYPTLLNSMLDLFTEQNVSVSKNSYEYIGIKEHREFFFKLLGETKLLIPLPETISANKSAAAFSLVSYGYLRSIFYPVQFFLPHSSACCGQWKFWEKINYFDFLKKNKEKKARFEFREKIMQSKIWDAEFKPEDFPEIVSRRLIREKAFDNKLNVEAMIKAMIIRMGEMAKPDINYEIIDYSIRSFFTYLGVKKYLRVDREMEFLRRFEREIMASLTE